MILLSQFSNMAAPFPCFHHIFLTIFLAILFALRSRVGGGERENKKEKQRFVQFLAKLFLFIWSLFHFSIQPCSFPNELANGKKYAIDATLACFSLCSRVRWNSCPFETSLFSRSKRGSYKTVYFSLSEHFRNFYNRECSSSALSNV